MEYEHGHHGEQANRKQEHTMETVAGTLSQHLLPNHLVLVRESLDGLALKSLGMLIKNSEIKKAGVFSNGHARRHVLRHMFQKLSERKLSAVEGRCIFIDEAAGLSLSGLRQRARRMKRRDGVTLFIVLGLPEIAAASSVVTKIGGSEAVPWQRDLKRLAVETNTAIVVLTSTVDLVAFGSGFFDVQVDLMCP